MDLLAEAERLKDEQGGPLGVRRRHSAYGGVSGWVEASPAVRGRQSPYEGVSGRAEDGAAPHDAGTRAYEDAARHAVRRPSPGDHVH